MERFVPIVRGFVAVLWVGSMSPFLLMFWIFGWKELARSWFNFGHDNPRVAAIILVFLLILGFFRQH